MNTEAKCVVMVFSAIQTKLIGGFIGAPISVGGTHNNLYGFACLQGVDITALPPVTELDGASRD